MGIFPVLLQGFPLVGEHGYALVGNGRGRVVLGGKDIAGRPADVRAERHQGLDQYGRLYGHVQGAGDAGALQGLFCGKFIAYRNQARHLGFGNTDLLVAPIGQGQVSNVVIGKYSLDGNAHLVLLKVKRAPL